MSYLIIGLGKSGYSAAKFLQQNKNKVYIYDDNIKTYSDKNTLNLLNDGAEVFEEKIHFSVIKKVVISPGVSLDHFLVKKLKNQNITIISEMELGLLFAPNKMIAVTGTNGKSTVCSLISHVLNYMNIPSRCVGNIGYPITQYLLDTNKNEVLIVEVSSFQLDSLIGKYFDVGVILNIYPHHLNRYKDFNAYSNSKLSLQSKVEKLYVSNQILKSFKPRLKKYSVYNENTWDDPNILSENLSAAFCVCKDFEIDKTCFLRAVRSFKGLPHRLEKIATINQISYFNDSKATNPAAVIRAIEKFNNKIILIAGGQECAKDFNVWRKSLSVKVKKIIAVGQCRKKIFDALSDLIDVIQIENLKEGVERANQIAENSDIILLSPGCPSYDQFKNFEERGDVFKHLVMTLKEERGI